MVSLEGRRRTGTAFTTPVTIQLVPESSGEENVNLYTRGVSEALQGEVLETSGLLEILDVFGEDGLRSYLVG